MSSRRKRRPICDLIDEYLEEMESIGEEMLPISVLPIIIMENLNKRYAKEYSAREA